MIRNIGLFQNLLKIQHLTWETDVSEGKQPGKGFQILTIVSDLRVRPQGKREQEDT